MARSQENLRQDRAVAPSTARNIACGRTCCRRRNRPGSRGGLAQEVHSGRGPNRQRHDLRGLRRAAHCHRIVT